MRSQNWSRRDFIKIGCGAAISGAFACAGLGLLAAGTPEIALVETRIEGATHMNRILVTYATRAGSTVQVAEAIAQTLGATGATVDLRPIKSVTELTHDAAVVGSAIRFGKWLPEAVEFVKNNKAALSRIPTAYFVVSGFLRKDTPEMRQTVLAYLDPVRKILEPTAIGLFAGMMDYHKLSLIDRGIAALVKEPEGDWRNWEAIRGWARDLQPIISRA